MSLCDLPERFDAAFDEDRSSIFFAVELILIPLFRYDSSVVWCSDEDLFHG
jgi:hypothetical protein